MDDKRTQRIHTLISLFEEHLKMSWFANIRAEKSDNRLQYYNYSAIVNNKCVNPLREVLQFYGVDTVAIEENLYKQIKNTIT